MLMGYRAAFGDLNERSTHSKAHKHRARIKGQADLFALTSNTDQLRTRVHDLSKTRFVEGEAEIVAVVLDGFEPQTAKT
jgi:alkyl sulfatase BDS1-like metallo-beta-lactamase superfamily hydrolase